MPTDRAADPGRLQSRLTYYGTLNAALPAASPSAQLAARFGSFANTVQTRLDSAGSVGPSLTGSLEAQVDRALSQVLRQTAPNGSSAGPGQALTQAAGQAVSVAALLNGAGGPPAIAPRQAVLVQEGTILKADAFSALDSLRPLSPLADPSDLASITAVIRAEITMLVAEFSRSTLRPRSQRVRVLLGGLLGWDFTNKADWSPGDVATLITLLNLGGPLVPTLPLEQQLANQNVLVSDAEQLLGQWQSYGEGDSSMPPLWGTYATLRGPGSGLGNLGPRPGVGSTLALGPAATQSLWRLAVINSGPANTSLSYSERLIQANLLLPVVAQDASRVAGALDAIGLSVAEQETTFLDLKSLVDMDLLGGNSASPPAPPNSGFVTVRTTVTDILDWTAGMADATTFDLVRQAGQLGLNLIADQADELFWLVVALLSGAQTQLPELGDAQVQTELLTLARDLNLLASLAV